MQLNDSYDPVLSYEDGNKLYIRLFLKYVFDNNNSKHLEYIILPKFIW